MNLKNVFKIVFYYLSRSSILIYLLMKHSALTFFFNIILITLYLPNFSPLPFHRPSQLGKMLNSWCIPWMYIILIKSDCCCLLKSWNLVIERYAWDFYTHKIYGIWRWYNWWLYCYMIIIYFLIWNKENI